MPYPASSSPTALGNVYQSSDGSFTETFVIPASPPYTHMIGAASPYNYPLGWQIIPPTGVSNAVTITGAAHASWTSVPSSPLAGQFVYDTSISPTGGTLTFAAGDAGATVTATWIGSTDVNKALMQALVTALHDLAAALGVPSGLAPLDSAGRILSSMLPTTIAATKFVIPTQTGNTAANNVANQPLGMFLVPSGTASGSIITVPNTVVTPISHIFLQVHYVGNTITTVFPNLQGIIAGVSFPVQVNASTTTTANVEVSYFILN